MTISKTIPVPQTNQELYLNVNYDYKNLEVHEIIEASIYIGNKKVLDITECLASLFNLDSMIDAIDWREIARDGQEIDFIND